MEFTPEWKSLWPISSTFSAPLLIQSKKQETPFGPLIFTPKHNSSITLIQSPSLSPRLPPQYPQLSFSRFLKNYNTANSSASSISSLFGLQIPDFSSYFHGLNSLQLLQIPNKNLVVVFFPTGENSDCVGYSVLSVRDGVLSVNSQKENFFHVVKEGNMNHQRVTLLLVNPVDEFCFDENGEDKCKIVTVGFLMVCTHYSVYWYRIGIISARQSEYSVCLDYLGGADAKVLRGSIVASACWSPHLREECLVLLENGHLLLFDVYSSFKGRGKSIFLANLNFTGAVNKLMHVSLNDKLGLEKEKSSGKSWHWFKCDFSWHPRVLTASHGTELFLVDLRSPGDCNISSLLKLETFSRGKNDQFVAFSRAGSDGFSFTVATEYLLLLCDVRRPSMPVLRWTHGVQNPRYMTVLGLSELRANAEDPEYKSALVSGYCIMLGSFWDNRFTLFCYGAHCNGNNVLSAAISNLCNSCYAWGLPSELPLSGSTCKCGSCLEREEVIDMSLPIWIDWRQKRRVILGFGILQADIAAKLSSVNSSFGGFVLIRLTSSGNLEAEHYHAAWEPNFPKASHKRKNIRSEESIHLYDRNHPEYDGVKKFQHFKLEFLHAYLKGKIEKSIVRRREKIEDGYEGSQRRHLVKSNADFHQEVCRKLKDFGIPEARSSFKATTLLRDISLPTSIHDVALRSMFSALPTNLMQFAFSTYSDFNENPENRKEPLEFMDIPQQPQVPPFPFRKSSRRSNRWSSKVQPSSALVGPTLPPLLLTTLHKLRMEELKEKRESYPEDSEAFSVHAQFKHLCDKVMEVVQEHFSGLDEKSRDMDFISLTDDSEYMSSATQKLKFARHEPSAFRGSTSSVAFSTHVFRRSQEMASDFTPEMVGEELFDVGCPVELKFDKCNADFGTNGTLQKLKRRDLDFQRSFKPYQDYITRLDG